MSKGLWILLLVVTIFLGVFTIGCGFQMLERAETGKSYLINLYLHPITSILFIILICILFHPLVKKWIKKQ